MARRRLISVNYQLPADKVWATVLVTALEGQTASDTLELSDADLQAAAEAAGRTVWNDDDVLAVLDAQYPLPLLEVVGDSLIMKVPGDLDQVIDLTAATVLG
jgi:hypothetical protein